MGKLGYIVGFSALFLVLSTVVGAASVIGLRGGENQADPGSVGNQNEFDRTLNIHDQIAQLAEDIARETDGVIQGAQLNRYKALLREHRRGDDCTTCSSLTYVVMKETGADSNFPDLNAEGQFKDLRNNQKYYAFALEPGLSDDCGVGHRVDSAKRGDLLYKLRPGERAGHAGVYIRLEGKTHITASASQDGRSPKIRTNDNLTDLSYDCGARLVTQPQASNSISTE